MSRFVRHAVPSPHAVTVQQLHDDFLKHVQGDHSVNWEERVKNHTDILLHILQHKDASFLHSVCKVVPEHIRSLEANHHDLFSQISLQDQSALERIKAICPYAPRSTYSFLQRNQRRPDPIDVHDLVQHLPPSMISQFVTDLFDDGHGHALNYLDLVDDTFDVDQVLRLSILRQNMDHVEKLAVRASDDFFNTPMDAWYSDLYEEVNDAQCNPHNILFAQPYWERASSIHHSIKQNHTLTLSVEKIQEKRETEPNSSKAARKI